MELSPKLSLGTIYIPFTEDLIYPKYVSIVKIQKWEGTRHPTLPDMWVGLYSLCYIS